jgi:hypothetical protein
MSMEHVQINGYIPLRNADVTADDTALTLDTAGHAKITDITRRNFLELDPAWTGGEFIVWGEGVENDTFGVELWGLAVGPGGRKIGCLMADITGTLGTCIADVTNPDSTSCLFSDDMTISDQHHISDISSHDAGNDRICKLKTEFNGLFGLYGRFYNVGSAGETDRVNMWMRPY